MRMSDAVDYVRNHPGCTKLAIVKALVIDVGGNRSHGYKVVDLAIVRGLIIANPRKSGPPGGRGHGYSLTLPKGTS